MKATTKAVAVACAFGIAGIANAINPATFNVTVNMSGGLSVAVSGNLPIGAKAPSNVGVYGPVTVTNDSASFVEDYTIAVSNSADWTIGAAQAPDVATMRVMFNSALPLETDFIAADQLIGLAGGVLCGALAAEAFVGNQDGQDVAPSAVNDLYVRFGMPTSDSSTGAVQTFTVTINAVAP